MREPPENSIGKKYGNLTVIEIVDKTTSRGEKFVRCKCDCGGEKICQLRLIRRGSINGCGCTKRKSSIENALKARISCEESGKFQSPLIRTQQMVFTKRYSDGDLSFDDFIAMSQLPCYYCGSLPSNKARAYKKGHVSDKRWEDSLFIYNGLDRVDNANGHYKNNVVPCCKHCNIAKLQRTKQDFLKWVRAIYNNHLAKGLHTAALTP